MEERIKELELERDNLLKNTLDIRLTKNNTTHSRIKASFNSRISMLKKYGVEYGFRSKEIRSKIHQSNLNKYGSNSILGNKEFREKYDINNNFKKIEVKRKIRNTSFLKYGVSHPQKHFIIKDRIRRTSLLRYGTANGRAPGTKYNKQNKYFTEGCFDMNKLYIYLEEQITNYDNLLQSIRNLKWKDYMKISYLKLSMV